MPKGGLIIRLIDVVMILLLGFIGISDFSVKTEIQLPTGGNASPAIVKRQVLTVRINNNSEYILSDGDHLWPGIKSMAKLESMVLNLRNEWVAEGKDMLVIINPHEDTMIQTTVDMIDLCEMHHIPKSIHYEL